MTETVEKRRRRRQCRDLLVRARSGLTRSPSTRKNRGAYDRAFADLVELANPEWKKWRRGEMKASQTEIAVREIDRFVTGIVDSGKLIEPAVRLARDTIHPVYDCIYVVLAKPRDLRMVTMDRGLVHALSASKHPEWVMFITDRLRANCALP